MYKHIMLPYDGSPLSDKALTEGIALAKSSGARITLIFVVAPYHIPGMGTYPTSTLKEIERQHQEELEKGARAMLDSAQQRVQSGRIQCDTVVCAGRSVYKEIIDRATNAKCDLVLMASHGRAGLESLLLGSETVKVLTHSQIPVLVVR